MSLDSRGKLLITGAAGFIGFEVTKRALHAGYEVTAFDALLGGLYPAEEKRERFDSLASLQGVTMMEEDLRLIDWEKKGLCFDYVVNLAAMPGLALSWSDFELYSGCNFDAVARLVEAARKWPLKKFIQISTSSVYGLNAVGDETMPLNPVSPYGVTKLAAENLLLAHFRTHGFPVAILRYFSVYGPGQRPDMAYRKFMQKALIGEPITLYGDGSQSRTNTYIDDVATATVSAIDGAIAGEVYNICGLEETSIIDAISFIIKETGSSSQLIFEPRVPGDQDRTAGDSTKARKDFGFEASTKLHDGLRNEIKFVAER
jgi:nucleoside-diphosphate-sugar epimerase